MKNTGSDLAIYDFYAAWAKFCNIERVVVGTPVADRAEQRALVDFSRQFRASFVMAILLNNHHFILRNRIHQ